MATEAPAAPVKAPRVGGNYSAVDNGDGTFDLLDVPVFAEVPAGAKRNDKRIGRDWMDKALLKNKQRAAEGHLPPVHIYHSDEIAVKPTYAGKLVLTVVKAILYDGKQIPAMFGNIIEIPRDVFEVIQKRMLPYRSVEVHDWNAPEIDALALLPTDVPFFRMPMTTVGRVVKRAPEMFRKDEDPGPAMWVRSEAPALAVCFRFADPDREEKFMADEEKKDQAPPSDKPPCDEKKEGFCGSCGKKLMEDAPVPGAPGAPPAAPDPMMGMLQQVLAAVQAIAAQMNPNAGQPMPPPIGSDNLAPVTGMKDKETKPPAAVADDGKKDDKKVGDNMDEKAVEMATLKALGPVMARLEKIEKRNSELEQEKAITVRMQMVERELKGVSVSDDAKMYLRKCAEQGDDMVKDAVAAFKKSLPAEPPKDLADFEHMLAGGSTQVSEAIAKFTAKHPGPKAAEWARAQIKQYAAAKSANPRMDTGDEEWLEINFRAESPSFA